MSNLVMWNLIVGFLAPNIIAIVQNPKMTSQVRALITFTVAIIGGLVTAYLNGLFNFGDIVGSILTVGVAAITFYKGLWKPTGVAVSIENATSSTPPTVMQRHPDDGPDERGAVSIERALVIGILAVVFVFLLVILF